MRLLNDIHWEHGKVGHVAGSNKTRLVANVLEITMLGMDEGKEAS